MENKENLSDMHAKTGHSKESVYGTILLVALIVCMFVVLAGVGLVIHTKWQMNRQESARPSIMLLATEQAADKKDAADQSMNSDVSVEQKVASDTPIDANVEVQKLKVSVLNGGGAKGSAAVVADFLKKEGYTQAVAGNATGDYAGVTVYYAAGSEAAAAMIKEVLAKKYPKATAKAALSDNKETATSLVTVILGK